MIDARLALHIVRKWVYYGTLSSARYPKERSQQMTTAWKALVESRLRSNIEQIGVSATYMSLATVKPDNTPANRTVVFR